MNEKNRNDLQEILTQALNEIKKGNFDKNKRILFVHTGGLYGVFPKQEQFAKIL